MSALSEYFEGKIDFVGQAQVEQIARIALVAGAIVSFIVGFVLQSLQITFILYAAFVAALVLIVIPPWPAFNRHPLKWLPVVDDSTSQKKLK